MNIQHRYIPLFSVDLWDPELNSNNKQDRQTAAPSRVPEALLSHTVKLETPMQSGLTNHYQRNFY